jgi:hypothetical protein
MKVLLATLFSLISVFCLFGQSEKVTIEGISSDEHFFVDTSENLINLNINEIKLENPYGRSSFPLVFSLVYQNHLISLFEEGKFTCHNLDDFERNRQLENKLNSRNCFYAWIIQNQLVVKSGLEYYYLEEDSNWTSYSKPFPLFSKNIPMLGGGKLFEDEDYIIYKECHGEWGGTIFFYSKTSMNTYKTSATCANSVIKKDGKYYILSHLGHMSGSASVQIITNPENLKTPIGTEELFSYFNIQIFSSFNISDSTFYMVHLNDETFLASIKNDTISIVHPLFNNDLYTHDPITTSYGDNLTLMNLDFYGIGQKREVSCIVIKDNNLTKINWKEK